MEGLLAPHDVSIAFARLRWPAIEQGPDRSRGRLSLSMDVRVALRAMAALPAVRLIVATAKLLSAPLATKDEKIRAAKVVTTVW